MKKLKIILITIVVVYSITAVYQITAGRELVFPMGWIDKVTTFLQGDDLLSIEPYKDGTIILVKPTATGAGDGRYEAGDIVEIRDGQELFDRLGPDKSFLGEKERTKLLPLYYPGKLTEEQKRILLEPEMEIIEDTEVVETQDSSSDKTEDIKEKIIKRRQRGIDYTLFLSNREIKKVLNGDKLKKLPEIDLSQVLYKKSPEQLSVVELSPSLVRQIKFYESVSKIARKIIPPVFAQATSESIIDPDSGSGYDYASLNAWEAAEQAVLTTTNEIALATCRSTGGSADTTPVTILGWTTDATRYIKIWTDPTESYRHNGVWDETKYRLVWSSGYATGALYIQALDIKIDGLQIYDNQDSYTGNGIRIPSISNGLNIEISNNIIRGRYTGSSTHHGIYIDSSSTGNIYVWNNIFYDFRTYGIRDTSYVGGGIAGGTYVYNNTVYDSPGSCISARGYAGGGRAMIAINNIVQNCADGFNGTFDATSDYNISDLSSDAPSSSYRSGLATNVAFVDEANDDFHLTGNDTAARDSGTPDPGSGLFSDDIDGDSRAYNDTWDIGADERSCADGWWSCQWLYRRKITLDNSDQASALTDFPVAVQVNSTRINYAFTQDLGQDIRFVDDNGTTTLQYEIEVWNESATSTMFVKVPNIAAASSTDAIWMYYGNTSATTQIGRAHV